MGIFKKKDDFNDKLNEIFNNEQSIVPKSPDNKKIITRKLENSADDFVIEENNIFSDLEKSLRKNALKNRKYSNGNFEIYLRNTFGNSGNIVYNDYEINTLSYTNFENIPIVDVSVQKKSGDEVEYFKIDGKHFTFLNDVNDKSIGLYVLGAYALYLNNIGCFKVPSLSNNIISKIKNIQNETNNLIQFNFCGVDFSIQKKSNQISLIAQAYDGIVSDETFSSPDECVSFINKHSVDYIDIFKNCYSEFIENSFPHIFSSYVSYNCNEICVANTSGDNDLLNIKFGDYDLVVNQELGLIMGEDMPNDIKYNIFNNYLLAKQVVFGNGSIPSKELISSKIADVFSENTFDFSFFGNCYKFEKNADESYNVIKHNLYNENDEDSILFKNLKKDDVLGLPFASIIRQRTECFFDAAKQHVTPSVEKIDICSLGVDTQQNTTILLSDDDLSL